MPLTKTFDHGCVWYRWKGYLSERMEAGCWGTNPGVIGHQRSFRSVPEVIWRDKGDLINKTRYHWKYLLCCWMICQDTNYVNILYSRIFSPPFGASSSQKIIFTMCMWCVPPFEAFLLQGSISICHPHVEPKVETYSSNTISLQCFRQKAILEYTTIRAAAVDCHICAHRLPSRAPRQLLNFHLLENSSATSFHSVGVYLLNFNLSIVYDWDNFGYSAVTQPKVIQTGGHCSV